MRRQNPSPPRGLLRENRWFFCTDVGAPLMVGGLIYLLWRAESLVMFQWVDALGGTEVLRACRAWASPVRSFIPEWVAYSIPDAMWVYACTAHFGVIWRGVSGWYSRVWRWLGWVLAFGGELGQGLGLVPGTFDWMDLLLVSVAAACAALRLRGRESA